MVQLQKGNTDFCVRWGVIFSSLWNSFLCGLSDRNQCGTRVRTTYYWRGGVEYCHYGLWFIHYFLLLKFKSLQQILGIGCCVIFKHEEKILRHRKLSFSINFWCGWRKKLPNVIMLCVCLVEFVRKIPKNEICL